jgi:hypothetical protein
LGRARRRWCGGRLRGCEDGGTGWRGGKKPRKSQQAGFSEGRGLSRASRLAFLKGAPLPEASRLAFPKDEACSEAAGWLFRRGRLCGKPAGCLFRRAGLVPRQPAAFSEGPGLFRGSRLPFSKGRACSEAAGCLFRAFSVPPQREHGERESAADHVPRLCPCIGRLRLCRCLCACPPRHPRIQLPHLRPQLGPRRTIEVSTRQPLTAINAENDAKRPPRSQAVSGRPGPSCAGRASSRQPIRLSRARTPLNKSTPITGHC